MTVDELIERLQALTPEQRRLEVKRVGSRGCQCCGPAITDVVPKEDLYEPAVVLD